jgi:hypothetical protein
LGVRAIAGDCPGTENSVVVGQQSFEHACVDDDCLKQVQWTASSGYASTECPLCWSEARARVD